MSSSNSSSGDNLPHENIAKFMKNIAPDLKQSSKRAEYLGEWPITGTEVYLIENLPGAPFPRYQFYMDFLDPDDLEEISISCCIVDVTDFNAKAPEDKQLEFVKTFLARWRDNIKTALIKVFNIAPKRYEK